MINKDCIVKKFEKPFPYIRIENFLEKKFFENLANAFPDIKDFEGSKRSLSRMDYDITFGDNLYKKLLSENSEYKKFHDYVYSPEFIKHFVNLFKDCIKHEFDKNFLIDNILDYQIVSKPFETGRVIGKKEFKKSNEKFLYPRLDLGVGIEGYGKNNGGGGIHIDNPQRLISILFYLGGYKKIVGGEHRIWKKLDKDKSLMIFEEIKPEKNCLVASLQNNLAFHDVNPIEYIEGSRNAFYLAISSSIPIWKKVKRNKFNIMHNKNRVEMSLFQKLKNLF